MEFYVYVLLLILLQAYYIWNKISASHSSLVKVVSRAFLLYHPPPPSAPAAPISLLFFFFPILIIFPTKT